MIGGGVRDGSKADHSGDRFVRVIVTRGVGKLHKIKYKFAHILYGWSLTQNVCLVDEVEVKVRSLSPHSLNLSRSFWNEDMHFASVMRYSSSNYDCEEGISLIRKAKTCLYSFECELSPIRPVLEARGYRGGVPRGHRALHPLALEVARQCLVLQ